MLLVSIHDVTPALASDVLRLWDLCAGEGITPALFIVPEWHGDWPLEHHPGFVAWLRERAVDGAELVLHGERHDEVGLPRRSRRERWKAWGRTAGEGEFLTLDAAAAADRMSRGLERLRGLGLEPTGFVPPAWLAREETHLAAGACGLRFTEDDRSIRLFPSGQRIRSPVVRWSARTPVRAWGSVVVASARWRLQHRAPCPRIAFHPQDLRHGLVSRSHADTLRRWRGRHQPGRYSDLASALVSQ